LTENPETHAAKQPPTVPSSRWTLRALLQLIPFIGRLTFRRGVPWKKASAETGVSVVLSSLSIWIGMVALHFAGLESTWIDAARAVVGHGELYILSSAAVTPLFYITLVKYRPDADSDTDDDQWITVFPHGVMYLLSAIVVLGISVVFIAFRAISDHPRTSLGFKLTDFIGLSWWLYGYSLFLFFTAAVHKNILEHTGASVLREDEKPFGSEFRKLRDA